MSFYEIKIDIHNFASAVYKSDDLSKYSLKDDLWSDKTLKPQWRSIALSVVDHELEWGDFFSIHIGGILGVSRRVIALPRLSRLFESSGELLPVTINDQEAYIFHSRVVSDLLDRTSSRMRQLENGKWIVYDPVFLSKSDLDYNIFRIPETVSLFTENKSKDDFLSIYQYYDFTGLEFIEKPSSDS